MALQTGMDEDKELHGLCNDNTAMFLACTYSSSVKTILTLPDYLL